MGLRASWPGLCEGAQGGGRAAGSARRAASGPYCLPDSTPEGAPSPTASPPSKEAPTVSPNPISSCQSARRCEAAHLTDEEGELTLAMRGRKPAQGPSALQNVRGFSGVHPQGFKLSPSPKCPAPEESLEKAQFRHTKDPDPESGISGKSQILFALVFTTRYLDLFTNFISIYNTVMKVVFLLCAYVTVYMIYGKFRKTFDSENDTFRLEFLLVPVIGLSFLENYNFTPLEILWTFSIYLESVAILPQLFMISKTGEAETITTHYLFFLGLYRALYLANWIRRYQTENFYDQIAVVSGVVQTIFYCDFFYLYVTKVLKGKKLSLPMPI
uniref:ER lumen protein-retaining receptor n=2 Tax=Equus caballus TaxID=9796 RepID=A0A9L0SB72_HORSE